MRSTDLGALKFTQDATSKVPCRYFLQGNCSAGSHCRFYHDQPLLSISSQINENNSVTNLSADYKEVCRFFLLGTCRFGSSCIYSHIIPPDAVQTVPIHKMERKNLKKINDNDNKMVEKIDSSTVANSLCKNFSESCTLNMSLPPSPTKHFYHNPVYNASIGSHGTLNVNHKFDQNCFTNCRNAFDAADDSKYFILDPFSDQEDPETFNTELKATNLAQINLEPGDESFAFNDRPSFASLAAEMATNDDGVSQLQDDKKPKPFTIKACDLPISDKKHHNRTSENKELCAFAIVGKCRFGANVCKNIHGLQCPRCLLYILDPNDIDRNEQHIDECLGKDIDPTIDSAHLLECGICLERIGEKSDPRFGLLSCPHAFCLSCIRQWRSRYYLSNQNFGSNSLQTLEKSLGTETVRSCPLCRTVTYFIVPSSRWIRDEGEKKRVIEEYKGKLSQIDCKHYNGGFGVCPFGSSCFYAHVEVPGANANGVLRPMLRQCFNQNEERSLVRETRLSDFIDFKFQATTGDPGFPK